MLVAHNCMYIAGIQYEKKKKKKEKRKRKKTTSTSYRTLRVPQKLHSKQANKIGLD